MPNDFFRKPIFWSAAATFLVALLLLLSVGGRELLDTKFYYSPQDALAYFMTREPNDRPMFERVALVDLFLFIPAYGSLLFFLGRTLAGYFRLACMVLMTVLATADVVETTLVWAGLREIGWESGWSTSLLSAATPIKWSALVAWILVFLVGFRRR